MHMRALRHSLTINPFNSAGSSAPTSDKQISTVPAGSNAGFEEQLSLAISESLRKVGVDGEVNITVRNSDAGRQIIVTYGAVEASEPAAEAPVAPENPFSGTAGTAAPVIPDPDPLPAAMEWCSYTGPKDARDQLPVGGGAVTETGAPKIEFCEEPVANQYGYTGLAARNPYFTSPSNPLRPGYVLGFENWFEGNFVLGAPSGPIPTNKIFNATEEGAQEALRLVQSLVPGAELVNSKWASEGGPYAAANPTWFIDLPNGQRLNAGGVLYSYYNQGHGVTAASDDVLARSLEDRA
jgi:hypothetical protein